jgi:hypothetical protein
VKETLTQLDGFGEGGGGTARVASALRGKASCLLGVEKSRLAGPVQKIFVGSEMLLPETGSIPHGVAEIEAESSSGEVEFVGRCPLLSFVGGAHTFLV